MKGRFASGATLLLVASSLLFVYGPLLPWLIDRFEAAGTYYSHGFLIPPICLWLAWRSRKRLLSIQPKPSWLGLGPLALGLVLLVIGKRVEFPEVAMFALPFILLGLTLYIWGKDRLLVLAFPILFLFFMVPLPVFVLENLAQFLKIKAVEVGLVMANLAGIGAVAQGAWVQLHNGARLLVGDPCSGLRSLIGLGALAFLLAFGFSRTRGFGKVVLLLAAIPIAFLSNALRIAVLCGVAATRRDGSVPPWIHDATGLAVYAMALFFLLGLDRILGCLMGEVGSCRARVELS